MSKLADKRLLTLEVVRLTVNIIVKQLPCS